MIPAAPRIELAPWLRHARQHDGLRERMADGTLNPVVRDCFRHTRFPAAMVSIRTPWCGAFACACLELADVRSPRTARARDFLDWGIALVWPVFGAALVFERGPGGGHVGFCDRGLQLGALTISCFGGNQGDAACSRPQPLAALLGVRWPDGWPLPPEAERLS